MKIRNRLTGAEYSSPTLEFNGAFYYYYDKVVDDEFYFYYNDEWVEVEENPSTEKVEDFYKQMISLIDDYDKATNDATGNYKQFYHCMATALRITFTKFCEEFHPKAYLSEMAEIKKRVGEYFMQYLDDNLKRKKDEEKNS